MQQISLIKKYLLVLGVAGVAATPIFCHAETAASVPAKTFDGYVAIGAKTSPRYVGGANRQTQFVPLLQFDYAETFYVYFDRIGVRLWASDDKKMGLGIAAEPRTGFRANDGSRLSGMETRHNRVEGGPSFEWEMPKFSFNVAYFTDWTDAGGGQSLRLSLAHQFIDDKQWDISGYTGFEYNSSKTVRYYFGVQSAEATSSRPFYQPGASLNPLLGFIGAYKFGDGYRYALMFGASETFLGAAAANSPIVERKQSLTGYFGLGRVF